MRILKKYGLIFLFAPKKTTPKPVIEKKKEAPKITTPKEDIKKIENEDIIKKKNRDDNLDKKEKMYNEYKKKQLKGEKNTFDKSIKMKKDFDKIWAKLKRDEKKQAKQTQPKQTQPVIENEIIEKKEEPKKTTAKQGKQTADQLAKRRAKYQENRAKELARKKAYRETNKEKLNVKQDAYRNTEKSKAYQKTYREGNKKPFEPKRTQAEIEGGVKAFGLPKGQERYKKDVKKEDKPRKVRTDKGKGRGNYNVVNPEEMKKKYPRPVRKDGESEEIIIVRRGIWDKVIRGKMPPKYLSMKSAVKIAYGDGVNVGGKEMTTSKWMEQLEKGGQNIERDGLGVGNLKKAEIDPDAVY